MKITSKTPHYLTVGDRVNICCISNDNISVDRVEVIDVLGKDEVALEETINPISQGANLNFEKVDLKCTLTFKLQKKMI